MNSTTQPLTLVLGGTGKTGRRIVDRLNARRLPVRVGSRSGDPAFDWEDRDTWAPALDGATAAYVSFFPDVAVPGAPEAIAAFAELAVASGTRRLVMLSGRGEEEAQRAEQALQATDAEWTIVRCSWFMQNFSEGFLRDSVLTGDVALPVGDIPDPFVDAEDIADVATAALTEPGHEAQVYELTGPRLLTFAEATAEIAAAAQRRVAFTSIPADDYAQAMRAEGLPDDVVALITYLFSEVLDGRNAQLADGVERALGRPPRDFTQYAQAAAAAGAWSRP